MTHYLKQACWILAGLAIGCWCPLVWVLMLAKAVEWLARIRLRVWLDPPA
jgi:hypothetical protein